MPWAIQHKNIWVFQKKIKLTRVCGNPVCIKKISVSENYKITINCTAITVAKDFREISTVYKIHFTFFKVQFFGSTHRIKLSLR